MFDVFIFIFFLQRYLQPLYVTSVGMLGLVGRQILVKEGVKETARENFFYLETLSALYGAQVWIFFFSGKKKLEFFSLDCFKLIL